jgi:hypothetical protein
MSTNSRFGVRNLVVSSQYAYFSGEYYYTPPADLHLSIVNTAVGVRYSKGDQYYNAP